MAAKIIPEEKITELKHSVDIVDVISDYVQLKKQGRNYFGLCPFHGENTPSFSVSQEKQIFHCFGCGSGGNVFTFLMEIEEIPFQRAAEKIAKRSQIELDIAGETGSSIDSSLPREHAQMIEAHELLAKFYHHILVNTTAGTKALEYLLARGFTKEGIERFQIGYSLPEWDYSLKFLEKHQFPLLLMEKAGLLSQRERDGTYFDRFRNRIMFPIQDSKGSIVAFSARAFAEEDQPKYLNSPETVIFNKSSLLYNYYNVRGNIRKEGYSVLFEGFADVISAHTSGVRNGVATMGTALTEQHIRLLKKLSPSVIICFDSDRAGINAAYRAGVFMEKEGVNVSVALMPENMDPDDYIQKFGAEKFRIDVIGNAETWTAFKLFYLRKGKNLKNEGERLEYIERALEELAKLENAVERELYLRQLSDEFMISYEALVEQQNQIRGVQPRRNQQVEKKRIPYENPKQKLTSAYIVAERMLLARMLQDEEILYQVMGMLGDANFQIDEHQAIYTFLIGYYEEGHRSDTSLFLNYLPDKQLKKIVTEISMQSINAEYSEKELRDYVSYVLKHSKMLMIKEKQAEQKMAERNKDMAKVLELAKEIIELRRSL